MMNLDTAFGIHAQAAAISSRRSELLASNMANAETPNYKARDLDFRSLLGSADNMGNLEISRTNSKHIIAGDQGIGGEPLYRIPTQPSIDGNTVDPLIEKAEFMKNSMRYQASLRFLNGKISSLRLAIKGE